MAFLVLAVVISGAGAARAESECGPPEVGAPIVCSSSNYNAATDGNIVYRPGETHEGDFTIRLSDDLSVHYDRHDPDDDQLVFPGSVDPLYSAVRVETDAGHTGDVSFFSSADVTTNARGISVAHYGKSGAMRTEISGGSVSITSDWPPAFGIHSYRGDEFDANGDFSGDHHVIVRDVDIDLDERASAGIVAGQYVEGNLNVAVQDSTVNVDAPKATGVWGVHTSAGDVDVEVRDVAIEVRGPERVDGILGYHLGTGDTDIALRAVDIAVDGGERSNGIAYYYLGEDGEGNLSIDAQDVAIEVRGPEVVDGILGYHLGTGDTDIAVRAVDIAVHGREHSNGIAYLYLEDGEGNLSIDAQDVDIEVHGERYLDGIFGKHVGTGDIDVDVRRAAIVTNGADSGGMSFVHDGVGGIDIAAREVDVEVHGDRSVGIGAGQRDEGTGDIAIDVRDSTIAVTGESVAGIRSFHISGEGSIQVGVDGGTIAAEGPDSSGILVGLTGRIFGDRTGPIKAPAGVEVEVSRSPPGGGSPPVGNAAQSVMVNGHVRGGTGIGAGVRLYGGGRVEIGPRGSVGAASGVAVRAEGEGAALHVGVALDGRRLDEAIAGDIRNDDGRTTIVVNGTTLHDGTAGATGLRAPHGARDMTLAINDTIAGRAFSVADFVTFYAPRAAVYEALPEFMFRLENRGAFGKRLHRLGLPAWVRLSVGEGAYEPDRSHVGAAYDVGRFEVEAGLDFALLRERNVTGWVSLRHVRGSADVSAPTGGGRIEAMGSGPSFGVSWENADGYYVNGRVSVTRYETDLRADGRGLLKEDVGVTIRSLGGEAGRRFSLADNLSLIPQARLTHSDVSMNGFRDAVGSRVSFAKTDRSIVELGIVTEAMFSWHGREQKLVLRGRLGVEEELGDAETVANVSGERLASEAARTRGVLRLGAAYRWDRGSLGAEVSVSGSGSDDSGYAASLRLVMQL